MIDFIKAKNAFSEYLKQYDVSDGSIKMKIKHTYEVIYKSEYIAKALGLEKEDIELAKLIALLHDIGRFEQIKETKDFSDNKSFDHADYGAYILFNKGFIRNFIEDHRYDEIIKTAIINHNKYQIQSGLNDKVLLHCKIIRDADKLDIFYEMINIFYQEKEIENINYSIVDDEILSKIYEKKTINRNYFKKKGKLQEMIILLAFLFDINYQASFEIIWNEKYINQLFQKFDFRNEETKQKMQKMQEFLNQYVEEKIKG